MRWVLILLLLVSCVSGECRDDPDPLYPVYRSFFHNKCGKTLRWKPNAFPLTVYVDPNLSVEQYYWTKLAMEEWNERIGKEVFTFPTEAYTRSQEVVYITSGSVERDYLGTTTLSTQESLELRHAVVKLRPSLHPAVGALTLVHELGHALGLKHNMRNQRSVMWPSIGLDGQTITEEDLRGARMLAH